MYFANPSTPQVRAAMTAGQLGQMVTPEQGNRLVAGVPWIMDNGCFSKRWEPRRYFDFLDRAAGTPGCVFAVVPDVVADASGTNRLWGSWHMGLMRRGFRTAYVLQDGATAIPRWCDAVFIGGSTEWKLSDQARELVQLAKRNGLWVHMGRVNSLRRLRIAAAFGCDSADGTFIAFAPDKNLPRMLNWVRTVELERADAVRGAR